MEGIEHRLWLAREVWILSRTCTRLWEDYNEQLMRLLSYEEAVVRIMMVDPNDGAVKMIVGAAEGFEHTADLDLRRATIEDLLRQLTKLRSRLKAKNLQVRTIDYLPAWTLVMIDPLSDKGTIYAELATFRANSRNRPTLSLDAERDGRLFQVFRAEFEAMWERARSIDAPGFTEIAVQ